VYCTLEVTGCTDHLNIIRSVGNAATAGSQLYQVGISFESCAVHCVSLEAACGILAAALTTCLCLQNTMNCAAAVC